MRLIDADALKESLEIWEDYDELFVGNIRKHIDDAPTIESERKKGKCIWCDSPYRIEYYWIDREGCTASFADEEGHVVATGIAKFCPNCGADMRGGRG